MSDNNKKLNVPATDEGRSVRVVTRSPIMDGVSQELTSPIGEPPSPSVTTAHAKPALKRHDAVNESIPESSPRP